MIVRLGLRALKGGFGPSRGIGYRRRGGGEGYFDQEWWEGEFPPILEEQIYKAGNPGQEAILSGDFLEAATDYCIERGEEYTPEDFIAYLQEQLDEDKFNAISIIIEECAEQLLEAWDNSFAGDGTGAKLFRD